MMISQELQANCTISFLFYLYFIFHAGDTTFDVILFGILNFASKSRLKLLPRNRKCTHFAHRPELVCKLYDPLQKFQCSKIFLASGVEQGTVDHRQDASLPVS